MPEQAGVKPNAHLDDSSTRVVIKLVRNKELKRVDLSKDRNIIPDQLKGYVSIDEWKLFLGELEELLPQHPYCKHQDNNRSSRAAFTLLCGILGVDIAGNDDVARETRRFNARVEDVLVNHRASLAAAGVRAVYQPVFDCITLTIFKHKGFQTQALALMAASAFTHAADAHKASPAWPMPATFSGQQEPLLAEDGTQVQPLMPSPFLTQPPPGLQLTASSSQVPIPPHMYAANLPVERLSTRGSRMSESNTATGSALINRVRRASETSETRETSNSQLLGLAGGRRGSGSNVSLDGRSSLAKGKPKAAHKSPLMHPFARKPKEQRASGTGERSSNNYSAAALRSGAFGSAFLGSAAYGSGGFGSAAYGSGAFGSAALGSPQFSSMEAPWFAPTASGAYGDPATTPPGTVPPNAPAWLPAAANGGAQMAAAGSSLPPSAASTSQVPLALNTGPASTATTPHKWTAGSTAAHSPVLAPPQPAPPQPPPLPPAGAGSMAQPIRRGAASLVPGSVGDGPVGATAEIRRPQRLRSKGAGDAMGKTNGVQPVPVAG